MADNAPLTLDLPDEAATCRLGAALAELARPDDLIALWGDLGAGKTTLARAFIRQWTNDAQLCVPSPTFTLVQIYDSIRGKVWHVDLYRLKTPDEVFELGWEEACGQNLVLLEWPQRIETLLPSKRLDLRLSHDQGGRRAVLQGCPDWSPRLAQAMLGG
ncbi:MAG: tRNA (adenosine(37)-N6)-threonylcarbamoyltransferase complex ATPase subunit type 1 TsaE [Alphaproteobacteria bacterium]|nr:MAG: tRNA (adenosine(37)-N6)-threonylcarbamoyltransferase complex ATPase subunit type 1 TsaE [Alphaproteobacteria bacterium]